MDLSGNRLCGVWHDLQGLQGTYNVEGITAIADALRVTASLTSIDLSHNSLGVPGKDDGYDSDGDEKTKFVADSSGIKAISQAISVSGPLTSINLSWSMLGPADAKALVDGGAFRGSLTECTLLKNEFDVETARMLAQISKEKKISLCGIKPDQTEASFAYTNLKLADGVLIAAALEFRGSLTQINLPGNSLGPEGAKALGPAISVSKSLTSIDLSLNKLDAEAAKALGPAISVSKSLTSINLWRNDIGAEGGKAIAEGIAVSKSLTSINLHMNDLGSEGGKAIAQGISVSKSLKEINLGGNNLCGIDAFGKGTYTTEGIVTLSNAISVGKSLTAADLRANSLSDAAKQMLHESVKDRVGFQLE